MTKRGRSLRRSAAGSLGIIPITTGQLVRLAEGNHTATGGNGHKTLTASTIAEAESMVANGATGHLDPLAEGNHTATGGIGHKTLTASTIAEAESIVANGVTDQLVPLASRGQPYGDRRNWPQNAYRIDYSRGGEYGGKRESRDRVIRGVENLRADGRERWKGTTTSSEWRYDKLPERRGVCNDSPDDREYDRWGLDRACRKSRDDGDYTASYTSGKKITDLCPAQLESIVCTTLANIAPTLLRDIGVEVAAEKGVRRVRYVVSLTKPPT